MVGLVNMAERDRHPELLVTLVDLERGKYKIMIEQRISVQNRSLLQRIFVSLSSFPSHPFSSPLSGSKTPI